MHFQHHTPNPPSLSIPKPITILAKGIQILSSTLTAKLGAKLFVTPINFATPKRERVMLESAQKKSVTIASIKKNIQVLSYGYSKKKVLLVHGWSGRSTQLYMIADKLLEKGYMVISFDGPAHGASSGKQTAMPEFLDTIEFLAKEFGPFEAAVGHSFGGMCLYNAVTDGLAIKTMVTIGSADKISDVILNFTQNLGVRPSIAKKMKQLYDKQWQRDINRHSPSLKAKEITIPVLVVHDSYDGDVPVSCALNIRQNLQKGTLWVTQGLGHTKILRTPSVAERIVEFILHQS